MPYYMIFRERCYEKMHNASAGAAEYAFGAAESAFLLCAKSFNIKDRILWEENEIMTSTARIRGREIFNHGRM